MEGDVVLVVDDEPQIRRVVRNALTAENARVIALLGNAGKLAVAHDDGSDIALALETGASIPEQRLEQFLAPLRRLKTIVVADGLLLRHLKLWLPQTLRRICIYSDNDANAEYDGQACAFSLARRLKKEERKTSSGHQHLLLSKH